MARPALNPEPGTFGSNRDHLDGIGSARSERQRCAPRHPEDNRSEVDSGWVGAKLWLPRRLDEAVVAATTGHHEQEPQKCCHARCWCLHHRSWFCLYKATERFESVGTTRVEQELIESTVPDLTLNGA